MSALLWSALAAGVLGSPHCAGMCGGFAAACGAPAGRGALAWHLGRLTTYAALGATAGAAGHLLPGPAWLPSAIAVLLLVWFAGALAGVLPEPRATVPGLAPLASRLLARGREAARGRELYRFAFGLLTGLLPCGMVYAALAIPVALASPGAGALAMLLFGAGTVPALAALGAVARRALRAGRWPRRVLAAGILAAGLWSLALRRHLPPPAAPATEPPARHVH